ncbi:MAG: serine/threonine-protein kinase [Archangium sp.]|nr:serine/threonine-protein kinase [Archangium sp.]MDP3573699.1 serine/threonine-protein kinase [Archangium sp.]
MSSYRYQALGPLQAGEGSRAFLGLAISGDNKARPVVIIWVPEAAEKDPELLAKIKRETEHASQLDHPHIVTVMGFGKLDEGHARVVEFADGESLRKILDTCKKMPPRVAARVVLDACTAVHYAHVAGNDDGAPLVHGDLRPETMLISFQGVTKVTGYGALAFAPRELGGQRVKGRRVHSAPEQIIGGRDAVSIPTDVYLLGITLYECLTGAVPWAEQAEYFDHAVLTLPLPPATPGDLPENFEPIIQKACSKKALDRYPTPLAMREALEAAAGSEVATDEELAKFLETLFPQSHELRAARRHTIDAGIADFVRRQWADQERRETVPMMKAIDVPAAMIPPSVVAPIPPRPAPVAAAKAPPPERTWTQPEEDDEAPKSDDGSSWPWIVALALFIAVIAGWWAWKKANEPIPGVDILDTPPKVVAAVTDAGPPPVLVVEPTLVDAGEAAETDAGATEEDAGMIGAVEPGVVDAGAPAVVAAAEVSIKIDSSPDVELLLEGKSLGRTPWAGKLPPGRKVFTLQNKALAISTTRAITLTGEPVTQSYTFEKGFVSVKAPEGAAIFIDGNRVGTAPIKGEIPVYEGSHRIQVTVGKSKWAEPFTLYGAQRVSFNVEIQ